MSAKIRKPERAGPGLPVDKYLASQMKDPAFAAAYRERRMVKEIAAAARAMREQAALSQAQLAALIGTTQSAIARFEMSADRTPEWPTLQRIATALGKQLRMELADPDESRPLVEVTGQPARLVERAERRQRAG